MNRESEPPRVQQPNPDRDPEDLPDLDKQWIEFKLKQDMLEHPSNQRLRLVKLHVPPTSQTGEEKMTESTEQLMADNVIRFPLPIEWEDIPSDEPS